jgi:hypothetical protein
MTLRYDSMSVSDNFQSNLKIDKERNFILIKFCDRSPDLPLVAISADSVSELLFMNAVIRDGSRICG